MKSYLLIILHFIMYFHLSGLEKDKENLQNKEEMYLFERLSGKYENGSNWFF